MLFGPAAVNKETISNICYNLSDSGLAGRGSRYLRYSRSCGDRSRAWSAIPTHKLHSCIPHIEWTRIRPVRCACSLLVCIRPRVLLCSGEAGWVNVSVHLRQVGNNSPQCWVTLAHTVARSPAAQHRYCTGALRLTVTVSQLRPILLFISCARVCCGPSQVQSKIWLDRDTSRVTKLHSCC